MDAERFRQLALSLPETSESSEAERPDFLVAGEIFASLFPADKWAVVKMTAEMQSQLVSQAPDSFEPCRGAWGRNGATIVMLENADEEAVFQALTEAWKKATPQSWLDDSDAV